MIEIRHASGAAVQHSYDAIYRQGRMYYKVDGFYHWLISLLHPKAGRALLDVACGEGQLLKYAQQAGLDAHGIDISTAAVDAIMQQLPNVQVQVANGEDIPYPDNRFDYITNIGSLEHYESPAQGVREMARVLKPGGLACILVPNTFSLFWNITCVLRSGDVLDDGQPIQRYATYRQWVTLLEANGLRVRRTYRHHETGPHTLADWLWFMRHPRRWIAVALQYLTPLNLTSSFVFLCSKR